MNWGVYYSSSFNNQVSCIDRQIAYLQAQKAAMLSGTCFTGYTVIDGAYEEKNGIDNDANEAERHNS